MATNLQGGRRRMLIHFAKEVRSAARGSAPPDFRQDDIGFRVVTVAGPRHSK
jgi:hypothetical protein